MKKKFVRIKFWPYEQIYADVMKKRRMWFLNNRLSVCAQILTQALV